MALTGTEGDILSSVARLGQATKAQIRKEVGFSLNYIGLLCRYLVRNGHLAYSEGYYYLPKTEPRTEVKTLVRKEPKVDRELIKEIAGEVAKGISGELKKTVKGIKVPVKKIAEETGQEAVKIKTEFELPVEDETLALESNIGKIGAKLEKEKSDIDKSIRLFKEIQKRGGKKK